MAETNSTHGTGSGSGSVLGLLRFGSGGSGWPYFARRSFARSRYCNWNINHRLTANFITPVIMTVCALCGHLGWHRNMCKDTKCYGQLTRVIVHKVCPKKLSKSDLLNPMSAFLFIQNAVCKKFVLLLILVRTHVSNYNGVVTIPHVGWWQI